MKLFKFKSMTKIRQTEFKIGYLSALNDVMSVVNESIKNNKCVSEAVKMFSEQKLMVSKTGKDLGIEGAYSK